MFKNALVSVTNKSGLAEFLKPLVEKGLRIVSTGGTAQYLKEHNIPFVPVQDQTGFPEVMDGRVRTLHPNIHMALLARIENESDMSLLREMNLEPFDLVIGNLYEFEKYREKNLSDRELVEYIDIGGPALLRAAAKNYHQTTVLIDPMDYSQILEKGSLELEDRKKLASKVFSYISNYDAIIAQTLSQEPVSSSKGALPLERLGELRYGENPQQKALWLKNPLEGEGLHSARILQGKPLSYNNLLDLDVAFGLAGRFQIPCCVGVKHNNPCGVAIADSGITAVRKSMEADPKSIFGGILAFNGLVTEEMALFLEKFFLECIVAPSYEPKALEVLATKKNLRVLELENFKNSKQAYEVRSLSGGYLFQELDRVEDWSENWEIIGEKPSQDIQKDLSFSWKVCAYLKSNAIAIVEKGATVGLGMGQVSRVDSVRHAIDRMREHHKNIEIPVVASDAFFPFPDSIEMLAQAGVKWVIQPGGSIQDKAVISAAQELGVNMVLTKTRHFRH